MRRGHRGGGISYLLAGILATWCLLNPGRAVAGLDLQLGLFQFYPSLQLKETYHSNLFIASENEEPVWITTITPRLKIVLPIEFYFIEVEGKSETVLHSEFSEEDSTNWTLGGGFGSDFPGGLGFRVGDEYERKLIKTSVELGQRETWSSNEAEVKISYDVRDTIRLGAYWTNTQITLDKTDDRDRGENKITGELYYRFRPKTAALFEVVYADFAYDVFDEKDNSSTTVYGGLLWKVTAKSLGSIKIGGQWKSYGDPLMEDGAYPVAFAHLEHIFTPFTTGYFTYGRESRESNFNDNPYFIRNELNLRMRNQITPYVYGTGTVNYRFDDYPNDVTLEESIQQREDSLLTVGLTVGFHMYKLVNIEASYSFSERNSSFDYLDFKAHEVLLAIRIPIEQP